MEEGAVSLMLICRPQGVDELPWKGEGEVWMLRFVADHQSSYGSSNYSSLLHAGSLHDCSFSSQCPCAEGEHERAHA